MKVRVTVQESLCTHHTYEITVPKDTDLEDGEAIKDILDRFYDGDPLESDVLVSDVAVIKAVPV